MFASHVYIHYRPYRLYTLYIYVVIICVRVYIHTHKYNIYIYTYTYTTDISESCYHVLFIPSLHRLGLWSQERQQGTQFRPEVAEGLPGVPRARRMIFFRKMYSQVG